MDLQKIGRYEIRAEIGRGGMATVFRAYDPRFKREVAVKLLPAEFLHDPQFRARFQREAEVIAALEHPAIVPVYDYGEDTQAGQPYLVMQLMSGGSLADRLEQGPLSLAEAERIFSRLAPALDRAHSKGIVHRDLKPGNILFDDDGNPYISDFGIAKLSHASGTFTGSGVVGTPTYISPEQARGDKDVDGRSDIYALGAILFQMLTGKLPYEADTPVGVIVKHITEPVPSILESNPSLPFDCEELVQRAMAKERKKRFERASELAQTLKSIAAQAESAIEVLRAEAAGPLAEYVNDEAAYSTVEAKARASAAQPAKKLSPKLWRAVGLIGLIAVIAIGSVVAGLNGFPASSPPQLTQATAAHLPETATAIAQATRFAVLKQQATATASSLQAQQTTAAVAAVNATATWQALQAVGGGAGRIAFESSGLWTMNVDGSELFLFTFTGNPDDECFASGLVSWSPDGTRVLLRNLTAGGYSLCVANADGSAARLLTKSEYPSVTSWSPDGRKIVFSETASDGTFSELYIVNADGSERTPLTATSDLFAYEPNWSPDGKSIVFRGHAKTVTNGVYDALGIYTVNVDGAGLTRLTDKGYAPVWSSDGKKILFMVFNNGANPDLYVMNADGSEQALLISGQERQPGLVSWSPDGRMIAFITRDGQQGQLFVMNSDGSNIQKLADNVSGFDWSPNGKKIAFSSSLTEGGHQGVYLINPDGTDLTHISDEIAYGLAWQP